MLLATCSIRTDGGTQPRGTIDWVTAADYADDMRAGVVFPPIVVFNDGIDYWLADGFHRYYAAQQADIDELEADVRQGTLQDAQWYSYSVNQAHGLRRTNEDKRRAVEAALQHPYAAIKSNEGIARHCGVSAPTVAKYRDEAGISETFRDTRLVTRNGSTFEMNVANIGARSDLDDDPLTPYEEEIAKQYNERYARLMSDTPEPEPLPPRAQQFGLMMSRETVEWYTPPDIIERARSVLGTIDLDPASSDVAQRWIQATTYYTAESLHAPWSGRVWLNPPFDDTPTWVDRLEQVYEAGSVIEAVLLVNSAPGYIWWEDLWRRRPVCMLRERLYFYRTDGTPDGQAKKGTTIAYYGEDIRLFVEVFGELGRIILPED